MNQYDEAFNLKKSPVGQLKGRAFGAPGGLNTMMPEYARRHPDNTPEEIQAAMKVVCGAKYVKDATDAKVILEALGLYDPKGK